MGSASIFGGVKDYSMRVWLNPTQMSTYKVTPNEVMAAIQDKSLEAAPGKFGERSKEVFEYVIKYKGKLTKPEDYQNIAIRSILMVLSFVLKMLREWSLVPILITV